MPCCTGSGDIPSDGNNSKKYGEAKKFDPNFKGPLENRSCSDVICCVIFLIFVVGMIACSLVGYVRGDPVKLIYPTDTYGNICGGNYMKDKKYLFFFDILKCADIGLAVVSLGCPTPRICVKSCPTEYWSYIQTVAMETVSNKQLSAERNKMICKYNVDPLSATKTVQKYIQDGDCAAYYVKTTSVMNYCVPSIFLELVNLAADIKYEYNNKNYSIVDAGNKNVTGKKLSDASYYLSLFYQVKEFVDLVFRDILASWWMILIITIYVTLVPFKQNHNLRHPGTLQTESQSTSPWYTSNRITIYVTLVHFKQNHNLRHPGTFQTESQSTSPWYPSNRITIYVTLVHFKQNHNLRHPGTLQTESQSTSPWYPSNRITIYVTLVPFKQNHNLRHPGTLQTESQSTSPWYPSNRSTIYVTLVPFKQIHNLRHPGTLQTESQSTSPWYPSNRITIYVTLVPFKQNHNLRRLKNS
ncbi:hypothetical protein Btru_051523 [Bulinus truncatus]|nr:hypothetical protein Btru_051523 [Bulinus truncatus]